MNALDCCCFCDPIIYAWLNLGASFCHFHFFHHADISKKLVPNKLLSCHIGKYYSKLAMGKINKKHDAEFGTLLILLSEFWFIHLIICYYETEF